MTTTVPSGNRSHNIIIHHTFLNVEIHFDTSCLYHYFFRCIMSLRIQCEAALITGFVVITLTNLVLPSKTPRYLKVNPHRTSDMNSWVCGALTTRSLFCQGIFFLSICACISFGMTTVSNSMLINVFGIGKETFMSMEFLHRHLNPFVFNHTSICIIPTINTHIFQQALRGSSSNSILEVLDGMREVSAHPSPDLNLLPFNASSHRNAYFFNTPSGTEACIRCFRRSGDTEHTCLQALKAVLIMISLHSP